MERGVLSLLSQHQGIPTALFPNVSPKPPPFQINGSAGSAHCHGLVWFHRSDKLPRDSCTRHRISLTFRNPAHRYPGTPPVHYPYQWGISCSKRVIVKPSTKMPHRSLGAGEKYSNSEMQCLSAYSGGNPNATSTTQASLRFRKRLNHWQPLSGSWS